MDSYGDANVGCPYFKRKETQAIQCEGAFTGSVSTVRFRNKADRNDVLKRYCTKAYKNCPLHRAVDAKYYGQEK